MRSLSAASVILALPLLPLASSAQETAQRDPRAVAVLTQAVAAMGGIVPADSVATGTVTIVAGSKTDTGTIRVLTRGLDQTAEQIETPEGRRSLVYTRGHAADKDNGVSTEQSMELALTSQSPDFPLVWLAAALSDPETVTQYLGQETVGKAQAHHVRLWTSFASRARRQPLAELSAKDIWIDAASGLPVKVSYLRRAARGAEPGIPLEVFYSDYRSVAGVLYPFRIEKSFNGTPWATITIQSVVFNTGLADAEFPVQ